VTVTRRGITTGVTTGAQVSVTANIHADVEEGDLLLAFLSYHDDLSLSMTTPTGWDLYSHGNGIEGRTSVYRRVAQAGDAGDAVVFTGSSALYRMTVAIVGYFSSTAAEVRAIAMRFMPETASGTSHASPHAHLLQDSKVVLVAADRSNSPSSAWTPPAGYTLRGNTVVSGSEGVSLAVADSDSAVAAGPEQPGAWTAGTANVDAVTWTVALTDEDPPEGWYFRSEATGTNGTSPATSVVVRLPPTASGSQVIVCFASDIAVTAPAGFSVDKSQANSNSGGIYRKSVSAGETSWTFTNSVPSGSSWWAAEVVNLAPNPLIEAASEGTSGLVTSRTTGTTASTTGATDGLAIAMFAMTTTIVAGVADATAPTGGFDEFAEARTTRTSANRIYLNVSYLIPASDGSFQSSTTFVSSTSVGLVAVYEATTDAGGTITKTIADALDLTDEDFDQQVTISADPPLADEYEASDTLVTRVIQPGVFSHKFSVHIDLLKNQLLNSKLHVVAEDELPVGLDSGDAGLVYYESTNDAVVFWNGTEFVTLVGGPVFLVLEEGDPIPPGTPAGVLIFRIAP